MYIYFSLNVEINFSNLSTILHAFYRLPTLKKKLLILLFIIMYGLFLNDILLNVILS